MQKIERWRNRLNTAVLVLPGQWFGLMAYYWLRFFPPLRPFDFDVPFPPVLVFLVGCTATFFPYFLPRAYFIPRRFELGSFYRRLGLQWFRYFATDGDLVNRALRRIQPSYRVVHDRVSLQKHLEGTYSNERWHLAFLIAGMLTVGHAFSTDQYLVGWLVLLTNVIFNLFPVLHQRYKRVRLRRLVMNASQATLRSASDNNTARTNALESAARPAFDGESSSATCDLRRAADKVIRDNMLLTVEDHFQMDGRGLVVVPHLDVPPEPKRFKPFFDDVRIVRPDGTMEVSSLQFLVEHVLWRGDGGKWSLVLLFPAGTKETIPVGSRILVSADTMLKLNGDDPES